MRIGRLLMLLLALALPGVLLAPAWRSGGGPAEEDSRYCPAQVLFHNALQAGQLPWRNPGDVAVQPSLADPRSAVFYPGMWLFAVLQPSQAYRLSLWLHYSLAFWGMYRLLRARRLARQAALFGGIAFAFCGFLLAHRVDLTTQHTAAWAPCVIWRLQRYVQVGGNRRLALAALAAALQCLAGQLQIAGVTALGSLVYLLAASRAKPRAARRWLLGWICAGGLFAVQWLPAWAYWYCYPGARHKDLDFQASGWNPISAVGWVLPMFFGQRTPGFFGGAYWGPSQQLEQFAYPGILPLVLAALAVRVGSRASINARGWVALLLVGLLLALGPAGPIYPVLAWIPGATVFREPTHALLLVHIAIAALAASVLHDLGGRLSPDRARLRAVALTWTRSPLIKSVGLVVVPLTPVALALPFLGARVRQSALSALYPGNPALWVPVLTVLISIAALWLAVRRWREPRWLALLVIVTGLDLGLIGWTLDVSPDRTQPATRLGASGRAAGPGDTNDFAEGSGRSARGRAFFEDAAQPGAVRYIEGAPYLFTTRIDTWPSEPELGRPSDQPALVRVVVCRPALPGWEAYVDGRRIELGATKEGLLVAAVPCGPPIEIEWCYSPPGLYTGGVLSIVTGGFLACGALLRRFSRRNATA
jgi:hypothetical protein